MFATLAHRKFTADDFDYVLDNRNVEIIEMTQRNRPRKKTTNEKCRYAENISKELCSLMAALPEDEYKTAIDRLNGFIADLRYNRHPSRQTSNLIGKLI